MKSIAKLLVFGLLMQHGVAQASWKRWISNELLGRKQAQVVNGIQDQEKFDQEIANLLRARPIEELEIEKAKYIRSRYNTACWDAVYLEERRNFIQPFGTLGLDCLSLSKSEKEKKYQDFKAGFYTKKCNFVVDTNICHDAILQFDLEQRVYQNRIIAVGSIVAAVAFVVGIMEGMNK